ncbi:MAG: hypothetical protein P8X73_17160 [Ignavibacteriaceae bacterium]
MPYKFISSSSFGFAFLIDYGNLRNSYKDVTWDQIAVVIGTVFRYYLSIIQFRIDFEFKFYHPEDMKFIFD